MCNEAAFTVTMNLFDGAIRIGAHIFTHMPALYAHNSGECEHPIY